MLCSEQSSGAAFLMLPFLLLTQPAIELPEREPECSTQRGGKYIGRDSDGVPEFEYTVREVCDE